MDGLVATFSGTDRVRTTWIVRVGDEAVVASLAIGPAYGVDRRKIEDIKAHGADCREALDHVVECPVSIWFTCQRAGKELVPGSKAGLGTLDFDGYRRRVTRQAAPLGRGRHDLADLRRQQDLGGLAAIRSLELPERSDECGVRLTTPCGGVKELARFYDLQREIGGSLPLDVDIVT